MRRGRRRDGEGDSDVVVDVARPSAASANGAGNGARPAAPSPVPASTNGKTAGARPRLGDLLVDQQTITREQLENALLDQTKSGARLGDVLIAAGAIDEHELTEVLARQFQIPLADLRRERPDAEVLSAISESVARSLHLIPLRRADGALYVVVADPAHPQLREELGRAVKEPVRLLIATPSEVRRAIDQSYRALAGVAEHIKEFEVTSSARVSQETTVAAGRRRTRRSCRWSTCSSPRRCATARPTCTSSRRATRSGCGSASTARCTTSLTLPADMGPALVSRIKVMAGMNIVERRRAQDGQIETSRRRPRARHPGRRPRRSSSARRSCSGCSTRRRSLYRLDDLGMPDVTRTRSSVTSCARRSAW